MNFNKEKGCHNPKVIYDPKLKYYKYPSYERITGNPKEMAAVRCCDDKKGCATLSKCPRVNLMTYWDAFKARRDILAGIPKCFLNLIHQNIEL